ncbi:MAG: NADH-quinone oxidoreductase subunit L [Candidatus Riflebacteria bacterium]|nr:NADH-quinone oxidoreductase subunit L [Candidatus Riflebacteria bacterium]
MFTLLILLPCLAVFLINLPYPACLRHISTPLAAGFATMQTILAVTQLTSNSVFKTFLESRFQLDLPPDFISQFMLVIIGLVGLVTAIVAEYSIEPEQSRFHFHTLLLLSMVSMNGIVLTNDLFTMYLFIEAASFVGFIMIAMQKDLLGLEASFKYIVIASVATLLMLSAIAIMLMITGETSFVGVHAGLGKMAGHPLPKLALGIFIVGLCMKSGIVPFHGWVADAYTGAPTATTVLVAGAITKVTGLYSLLRLLTSVFGFNPQINVLMLTLGVLTILIGALSALSQRNAKRMLAYSSVSQSGYILLGIGTGSSLGIAGALFHAFNHAINKALLFTNAAAVEYRTKTLNMDEIGGAGHRMPVTMVTSIIGSMSVAGLPPLSGFWSKLLIIIALWKSGFKAIALFAALASLLTLAYMLSFQRRIFFARTSDRFVSIEEAPRGMVAPAIALGAVIVGIGLFLPFNQGFIEVIMLHIGSLL